MDRERRESDQGGDPGGKHDQKDFARLFPRLSPSLQITWQRTAETRAWKKSSEAGLVPEYAARRYQVTSRKVERNGRTKCQEADTVREPMPAAFNRSETIVSILIAFCIGNAVLSIIYRMMG